MGKSYKNDFTRSLLNKIKLTEKQSSLVDIINDNTITFVRGCWGTGKSYTTCYSAYKLLGRDDNHISKCIITKPIVESGENLGFLKGDLFDKLAPYAESYWSTFENIADKGFIDVLRNEGTLEFKPVAYMRGSNHDNAIILLDEGQNFSVKQMITFITRLGKDSKMVIIGDHSQSDISEKGSGFSIFWNMLQGVDDIGFFEFTDEDIKRNQILIDVTKKYREWKENHYLAK